MKMKNESIVNPRIQKAIKKLIADEFYSSQYYTLTPFAVEAEQYGAIYELFKQFEISAKTKFNNIIEWAIKYGIDIPHSEAEMKKIATSEIVKKVSSVKKKQTADFYINKAIEIENIMLKIYKDTTNIDDIAYFTDLQSILWQNYYDKADNIGKLQTAIIAFEASCDLVMN